MSKIRSRETGMALDEAIFWIFLAVAIVAVIGRCTGVGFDPKAQYRDDDGGGSCPSYRGDPLC